MKVIHFKNRMLSSFIFQWSHEWRILRIAISLPSPWQPLLAAMFYNCYQLWLNEWHCHFLPALWVVNHRLQCSSQELSSKFALKLVSNRKMLKSCASTGCTKRQVSRVSIHIFPVGKVRQKQWLASLKLVNPPVLKHAVPVLHLRTFHFSSRSAARYEQWRLDVYGPPVSEMIKYWIELAL